MNKIKSVWILLGVIDYEGSEVLSAHPNITSARKAKNTFDMRGTYYDRLKIERHEVTPN